MTSDRLHQQVQFMLEIDPLKQVLRQTLLRDGSRRENTAEHSWHIALMVFIFAEYAPPGTDLHQAVKMLLLHDLVEIDAGDTPCYDVQGNIGKAEREQQAADRLFGLLPVDQAEEFRGLWDEFEAQTTPTARFAAALDRLQPLLLNQQNKGENWQRFQVTRREVEHRVAPIQIGAPALWPFVQTLLDDCVAAGYLAPAPLPVAD
jgi:putative hydrolases of HD superfamily